MPSGYKKYLQNIKLTRELNAIKGSMGINNKKPLVTGEMGLMDIINNAITSNFHPNVKSTIYKQLAKKELYSFGGNCKFIHLIFR